MIVKIMSIDYLVHINNNWMMNFNRYQSTYGDVSKCVSFKLLSLFS
jgi:hypothetical protein